MLNRYADHCDKCGLVVPAKRGVVVKVKGQWVARHLHRGCDEARERQERHARGEPDIPFCLTCGRQVPTGEGVTYWLSGDLRVRCADPAKCNPPAEGYDYRDDGGGRGHPWWEDEID